MSSFSEKINKETKQFKVASWGEKASILSFVFLALFFFDCSLLGGGKILAVGPLTSRMALAGLAICFSLPEIFKNFKKWITHPINLMVIAFVLYFSFSAVRGYLANNRMDVLISDVKGFMWLVLVPVVMAVVNSKKRFETLLTVIAVGSVCQAIFVICLNWFCAIVPDGINYVYYPVMNSSIGTISNISHIVFRIFMKSSPYMALTCGIAIYRQIKEEKVSFKYVAIFVLCAFALLLSFTRSIYGCIFVVLGSAIALIVLLHKDKLKLMLKYFCITLAVFLAFTYVQEFAFKANYMNFAISRTFNVKIVNSPVVKFRYIVEGWLSGSGAGSGDMGELEELEQEKYLSITDESDNIRAKTKADLRALIAKNPIIGNGLGASAASREDGLDEYFYLDVLARMGIIGLILYILPFAYLTFKLFLKRELFAKFTDANGAMCGMLGFWAVSWFNPWMNAVLGIACYALCCSVLPIIKDNESKGDF